MALFEFEDGRLFPAQFGHTVPGGMTPDVVEAVCGQLLEIVARPLFPITWRDVARMADGSGVDRRLIALDTAGQVVSVEVVSHLDSDVLISSLSRLAETAALSWSDLAHEYPGDLDGFRAGWLHFRDSMPPAPGSGPRLVMVVASIDPTVRPALDVLAESGVEVHEMALRQMSNGRTFLDVQPVGSRIYGHSPQVIVGTASQVRALDSGNAAGRAEVTATGEVPVATGEIAATTGTVPVVTGTVPAATEEPVGDGAVGNEMVGDETIGDETLVFDRAQSVDPVAQAELVEHDDAIAEVDATNLLGQAHSAAAAASHSSVDSSMATEVLEQARAEGIPVLARDAVGLQSLAQFVGERVPVVLPPSAGVVNDVALDIDGYLHIGDSAFATPEDAVAYLQLADVDGWLQLRLMDLEGPTLAESIDEINREMIREYRRIPTRSRRSRH